MLILYKCLMDLFGIFLHDCPIDFERRQCIGVYIFKKGKRGYRVKEKIFPLSETEMNFKIVLVRQKNFSLLKKIFSRKLPPLPQLLTLSFQFCFYFYLTHSIQKVLLIGRKPQVYCRVLAPPNSRGRI